MKPHVALDFDGVICDSVDECHITALNAYHRLAGEKQWVDGLESLNPAAVDRFRSLRYLARNAAEFWLLIHLTYHQDGPVDEDQFACLSREHAATLAAFEPGFFEAREQLRSADLGKWLDLHRIYPQFLDGWKTIQASHPVYLVTTKDLASIQHFIRHWKLSIPEDHLWTKERGTDKAQAVLTFAETAGVNPADFFFVDDHPHHVRLVAATGARCFWASWGFLGAYGPASAVGSKLAAIDRMSDLVPHLGDH
ncbi:MAG: hypothetical protein JSW54_07295 [Fidelibacterota bacterium]|nr:MAG: hypothetical protein JSW54_07295 [Candidatus Neomarinimicrobiota bacterium]